MPSAISGFTPTTTAATTSSSSLGGMTSGDFLNLMIKQLQQQDPLNPTDSNQLLTQMSQISTLQSNTQMQQSLQGLTLQQSIGSAGNLIGKMINGIDDSGNALQGVVTSVKVVNKQVRLELDSGNDLPMENVTQIATASTSALASAASALPQLQQLLGNTGGTTNTTSTTPAANLANLSNVATSVPQLQALLGSSGGTNVSSSQLANLSSVLAALGVGGS